MFMVNKDYQ